MFIVGGFNCYPAEIEKLMFSHEGIAQVAVIGIPDERMGEVGMAFVVPVPGADLSRDEVVAWCREHMANYKVPRRVAPAPVIMAGVRTAAVITVGTTTLAAFIGAGGLGVPIVAGLQLADTTRILAGALPAALLALAVDALLGGVERGIRPRGL